MKKRFFVQPLIQPLYQWYRKLIRNSKYRWIVIAGSLLYLVSPIDISADVFPIIGWIDDGIIATMLVTEVSQVLLDRVKSNKNQDTAASDSSSSTEASTVA